MELTYKQHIERNVSHETFSLIMKYIAFLKLWNRKIALISNHLQDDDICKHILDVISIQEYIADKNAIIVDVGSGNGFVGVILSILGYTNCNLVEINNKKTIFLLETKRELDLNFNVYHEDINKFHINNPNCIIAKAFNDISKILANTAALIKPNTKILIFKTKHQIENEIKNSKEIWTFNYKTYYDINDVEKVILELSDITKIN